MMVKMVRVDRQAVKLQRVMTSVSVHMSRVTSVQRETESRKARVGLLRRMARIPELITVRETAIIS
jgi:hypothetical protein